VTFTAPASGASAVFSSSGSSTLTVGSDDIGNVAAAMLAANATPGSYTVTASSAYGTVTFSLTNTAAGIASTVTPLAPTSEQATVDGRYPQPLAARVLDANGNPVVNATVTFTLGAGGGAGSGGDAGGAAAAGATFDGGSDQATATTNSDGIATSPSFSANATSGAFTASASTPHAAEPASFALDNLAAKAPTVTAVGSTHPSATVDTRYGQRLQIRVRQADGDPDVGATVTFVLGSSGGATGSGAGAGASFVAGGAQATATTGANGVATSPPLTANTVAGTFTATATATVSGTTDAVSFTLRNRAGSPATITLGVAARESAVVGDRFAIPLAVTVTDAKHNPVPGAEVTFTAPASGASGTFAHRSGHSRTVTVRTDAAGVAVAPPFTANGQPGGYIVMAAVRHARSVAFALVNEAP
jgi:adhesin/invasin